MKHFLYLSIYLISSSAFSQKANDETIKTNFHYLTYPEREGVSTKVFGLSVSEEYSCEGAVPAKTYTTPITVDPRGKFYLGMVPEEKLFFSQARDLYGNLISKKEDFTDITIHTNDIRLTNQTQRDKTNPKVVTEKLYFLSFDVSVLSEITIRRRGSADEVLLESNSSQIAPKTFTFPTDVLIEGSMTDIERNGFKSPTAMMNAWNKYRKYCTMQWRDKLIREFLTPVFKEYKDRFMMYENWEQAKIISDKNKKGGYEHIVTAAENYIAVFTSIEIDYKEGRHTKQWKKEYQEQINTSLKVWEALLAETNFDVTVDDKLISDDYRQKIMLNYVEGLILTGQFDKADQLIEEQLKAKLRNVTISDLNRLKRTLVFEKSQFEIYSASKGWVKL